MLFEILMETDLSVLECYTLHKRQDHEHHRRNSPLTDGLSLPNPVLSPLYQQKCGETSNQEKSSSWRGTNFREQLQSFRDLLMADKVLLSVSLSTYTLPDLTQSSMDNRCIMLEKSVECN